MMNEQVARESSPMAAVQVEEREGMRVEAEEEEAEEGRVRVESRDGPVTLCLLDAALWLAFKREGTEMIITKAGRRMFPFVMVKLEGLSPTLLYSVHLSLVPCDHRQYKFCQRRWVKVSDLTPGPTPTPDQAYTHPASPNRGSFWCQEMISFAKMKITNNKHSQGDIVLQSMRKYMAQIIVREDLGDAEYVFPLPETTFVAVTQYQNEAVTRMKIAHNPFANGFKYAHVTGNEDGKKLFSRSELSRCPDSRQKQTSSAGKPGTKAARVKAPITRQTLTPVILNPHNPDDLKLVSSALSLPGTPQPLYFSPTLALEAEADPGRCLSLPQILQGGFQVPSTAAVSPYVFRSSEEGESPDRDVSLENDLSLESSPSSFKAEAFPEVGESFFSPAENGQGRESVSDDDDDDDEEEIRDEVVMNSSSPTTIIPVSTLPTTVTDSAETAVGEILESRATKNNDAHVQQSTSLMSSKSSLSSSVSASSPGMPTNLSKKGGPFKHPLPRRGSVSVRKGGKRSFSGDETGEEGSSASGTTVDSDLDVCKTTLHRVGQRHKDWAVKHDRGVQLKLHDGHIWHSFATCGSKMILSPEGRNMFPVISISLRGLDPGRLYSVWLHVTAADADVTCSSHHVREPTLWGSLLSGTSRRLSAAPPVKPYMHPCSPMRGLAWMKVKVNFSEVKLTTTLTHSDSAPVTKDGLSLQCGHRYLTQIVVREEEEVTPSGAGLLGNIYFFPLQEVTFVAKLESEECKSALPAVTSVDNGRTCESGKRCRDNTDNCLDATSEEPDATTTASTPPKMARVDTGSGQWLKSPNIVPRHPDLAPLLSRPPDFSSLLSRQPDLCGRINPLYCYPPFSTLPPAHVGLLANRMPLPVASPLQSIASFPFHSQLFPQLRSPMHTAFGMPLASVNPFPYCYYPYPLSPRQMTLPSSAAAAAAVSDASKGLDLSLKSSESV